MSGCLLDYIFIYTCTSHTCTHTYIFSFETKPKVSQQVKLARDRKSIAVFGRWDSVCVFGTSEEFLCVYF